MGATRERTHVDTKIVTTIQEVRAWRSSLAQKNLASSDKPVLGLVTTMGALHEGHLELIRRARADCRNVIVTIFVNPTQFGPTEDFDKYPRTFDSDMRLCKEEGVDVVLHPSVAEIYPGGLTDTTKVLPPAFLEKTLYGEYRPAFFGGVTSVLVRLFNIIEPDLVYYGEKDYQQLVVVRRLVADLHMPITVIGVPTVREKDGLAMSSRNVMLSSEQRKSATKLYRVLCFVQDAAVSGKSSLSDAIATGSAEISSLPNVSLKYLVACDPNTLETLDRVVLPMVLLVAAKFGDVWLIDTLVVQE
jgi:pantoate--beta-alanine ligase